MLYRSPPQLQAAITLAQQIPARTSEVFAAPDAERIALLSRDVLALYDDVCRLDLPSTYTRVIQLLGVALLEWSDLLEQLAAGESDTARAAAGVAYIILTRALAEAHSHGLRTCSDFIDDPEPAAGRV